MGETDRQTDKTSRWAFTAYKDQWSLFDGKVLPNIIAEVGWQSEICPDTQREHYQGYIRTTRQVRFSQLSKIYPKVHIEPARNWAALLEYCNKSESAIPGTQQHHENKEVAFMTMEQALTKLVAHHPYVDASKLELKRNELKAWNEDMFWECVNTVLETEPALIALYHQPQYVRCFQNTKRIWMALALVNAEWHQTDRQTDVEFEGPAFEDISACGLLE